MQNKKGEMTIQRSGLFRLFLVIMAISGFQNMARAETSNLVFQVTTPDSTSGLSIHLAGNFQGWNPGDKDYLLDDLGDGLYEISLPMEKGHIIHFKFTQGNWATVEKGPDGEELANRSLHVKGSGSHKFHIASWAHQHPEANVVSTITGDVNIVEVPGFLNGRDVSIYLPPNYYKDLATRFPVLYMFDGQNVFDAATSFAGEWEVDESCERLIAQGKMAPVIVVAVANGQANRIEEYTPWPDSLYTNSPNGGGAQHLQTIVDVLLPYINSHYRTLTGPENTGIAGSSLGGLMAIHAAGKHQGSFGKIAAFSPSLWWKNEFALGFAKENIKPGIRLYLDMGAMEGNLGVNSGNYSLHIIQSFKKSLEDNGFVDGINFMVVQDALGEHNEATWARRLPGTLMFLFPFEEGN
jgi:predicted alpha/beta superfamily hydrolase